MLYRGDVMFKDNDTKGFLVAIDGPNGVGKSTLYRRNKNSIGNRKQ